MVSLTKFPGLVVYLLCNCDLQLQQISAKNMLHKDTHVNIWPMEPSKYRHVSGRAATLQIVRQLFLHVAETPAWSAGELGALAVSCAIISASHCCSNSASSLLLGFRLGNTVF